MTTTDVNAAPGLFPSRRQGDDCLSDLALDRLMLSEGSAQAKERAQAHLSQCEACQSAYARLQSDREQFLAQVDVPTRAAQLLEAAERAPALHTGRARRWMRAFALPLGFTAAAAAALLFVGRPDLNSVAMNEPGATRTKGDFQVSAYVHFRDRQQPGTLYMGEPLAAGDKIQFRVSTTQPGYLVIVGVDSAAQVSVFYPPGQTAVHVEKGRDVPLDTAVEMDATAGQEVVVALRCQDALPTEQVISAARAAVERARQSGLPATSIGTLGLPCVETRTTLTKVSKPVPL